MPTVAGGNSDAVTEEIARWAALSPDIVADFEDDDGLVNEFALMWKLRDSFPLHTIVFKQCASHMSHEGNTEQLFSRAGGLSDSNGKSPPHRLATWTSIGANRSVYEPPVKDILARYYLKFSKGGKLDVIEEYHVGLDDAHNEEDPHSRSDHFARFGEAAPQNLGVHAGTHHHVTMAAVGEPVLSGVQGQEGQEEP